MYALLYMARGRLGSEVKYLSLIIEIGMLRHGRREQ